MGSTGVCERMRPPHKIWNFRIYDIPENFPTFKHSKNNDMLKSVSCRCVLVVWAWLLDSRALLRQLHDCSPPNLPGGENCDRACFRKHRHFRLFQHSLFSARTSQLPARGWWHTSSPIWPMRMLTPTPCVHPRPFRPGFHPLL